jgi:CubicO group peptidase (beta-lactamase class C family)
MEDTGYDPRAFETAEIVPSFHETYGANLSVAYAAGGMYSTAKDLVLWDRALSRNLLLSQSYQDQIFTPYTKSLFFTYGYGWVIESIRGEPVYSHGGGILGFRSYIVRRPESDQVVVFLCNVEGGNPSILANRIVRELI